MLQCCSTFFTQQTASPANSDQFWLKTNKRALCTTCHHCFGPTRDCYVPNETISDVNKYFSGFEMPVIYDAVLNLLGVKSILSLWLVQGVEVLFTMCIEFEGLIYTWVLYYVSCELHPYEYINMVLCGRFSMCAYIYVDTFYLHSNGLMTHFKP